MIDDLYSGVLSVFGITYPTEERRRFVRRTCRYCVYVLEKRKISDAIVADIGPEGLRFETVKKYRKGEKFQLIYRGTPGEKLTRLPRKTLEKVESRLPCKVLWCQRSTDAYEVGVKFEVSGPDFAKTWAYTVLEKLTAEKGGFDERRKHTRARACLDASLRGESETVAGLMVNVGMGGALVQSTKHLRQGETVHLTVKSHPKLPTLRVEGDIVHHEFDVVSNSGIHCIRFKSVDDATQQLLSKYVSLILRIDGSG